MENRSASRKQGCRVTEFSYLGYAAVALENQQLRVVVLPGKGSDIIQFLYKPQDIDFMWASEPGLPPAGAVRSPNTKGNAFLDYYPGGWQEILPNFGDACEYKNAALGLHDEVSLLPWTCSVVQDEPHCVSIALEVRCLRTPFRLRKQLSLRSGATLEIREEVVNESAEDMDCTWGHHPAFGAPFLTDNCRVIVPPCRVKTQAEYVSPNSRLEQGQDCEWPVVRGRNGEKIDLSVVPSKSAHSHDMAYLYGFEQGWYALFDEKKKLGFAMRWDDLTFKYLWFWQVYGGWSGYPWYGNSYNIGLEPCSSYPQSLTGAVKNGTQLKFAPGTSMRATFHAAVILDADEFVRSVSAGGS